MLIWLFGQYKFVNAGQPDVFRLVSLPPGQLIFASTGQPAMFKERRLLHVRSVREEQPDTSGLVTGHLSGTLRSVSEPQYDALSVSKEVQSNKFRFVREEHPDTLRFVNCFDKQFQYVKDEQPDRLSLIT